MTNDDELITTAEAAAILDVQPGTLEVWRSTQRYPLAFVRVGRNVRYRRRDLMQFIERRTVREAA